MEFGRLVSGGRGTPLHLTFSRSGVWLSPWGSSREKVQDVSRGTPPSRQCGANSIEPSFAGGGGTRVGDSLGAGAGSGGGTGAGAGTGGVEGWAGVDAAFSGGLLGERYGFGLELTFASSILRPRRSECRGGLAAFKGTAREFRGRTRPGSGSASGRTTIRGNPTSAPKGGGSGGRSSEGSTCSTTSPPMAIAATFPAAFQRIRTLPTPAKDQNPGKFSPQPPDQAVRTTEHVS